MSAIRAINYDRSEDAPPTDWFTEDSIAAQVHHRTLRRGYCYFEDGAVRDLRISALEVTATVLGTRPYRVAFRCRNHDRIDYECTCPVGRDNKFCKHCVAAALALIARTEDAPRDESAQLRVYLEGQPKDHLITLLLEHAEEHPALRRLLEARAAANAKKVDVKALRNTIDRAFRVDDFLGYRAATDFCRDLYPIVEALVALPENGRAAEALPLIEYALERAVATWEMMDDSGGRMGDLFEMLARAHCRAAILGNAVGVELANQLNRLKTMSPVDYFPLAEYLPALGDAGLARYRWLLQSEWRKVPPRNPEDRRPYHSPEPSYFCIKERMRELARLDGDVEPLIDIERRDLSSPSGFLAIAKLLDEAGRHDEALAWMERVEGSFPDQVDGYICEYLIAAYTKQSRDDDALRVAWRDFSFSPDLAKYKTLKRLADATQSWPQWRAEAITTISRDSTTPRAPTAGRSRQSALLIEIHLWEEDVAAALAEANTHGCPSRLIPALAQACEKSHLDDAVGFYKRLAADCIERRNNSGYATAAEYIRKIGGLLEGAQRRGEFETYLQEVRMVHRAKRNFMGELGG